MGTVVLLGVEVTVGLEAGMGMDTLVTFVMMSVERQVELVEAAVGRWWDDGVSARQAHRC